MTHKKVPEAPPPEVVLDGLLSRPYLECGGCQMPLRRNGEDLFPPGWGICMALSEDNKRWLPYALCALCNELTWEAPKSEERDQFMQQIENRLNLQYKLDLAFESVLLGEA